MTLELTPESSPTPTNPVDDGASGAPEALKDDDDSSASATQVHPSLFLLWFSLDTVVDTSNVMNFLT
jgi:hypothetical protein